MLVVDRQVLTQSFEAMRECGRGANECVVYWTGPGDQPGLVDDCVQLPHRAGPGWYEIEPDWITAFFLTLRATRCTARAQVHTHPGDSVRHSPTDDGFPLAASPGFVSIVVPHYAVRTPSLDGAYLTELALDGRWVEQDSQSMIQWQ